MHSVIWYRLNGILRYALTHSATRLFPLYVVNEYPKSGGTWVGEMLADAIGVPFPRNRLPVFRSSILHGHIMQSWNVHNMVVVWRDGRDVLVSQYFHWLFDNDRDNSMLVREARADLGFSDYNDVAGNLPEFMRYVYERKRHPRMSWSEFAARWAGCRRCVHVRYEDMRMRPVEELRRVTRELAGISLSVEEAERIVGAHSFERLSGRRPGEESAHSFMRKGLCGDWKNYFDQKACNMFHEYAGGALVLLGYEPDSDWVTRRARGAN